jgi:CDP-diacylglycerol---serine O-phosphatidyltransferase
MANRSATSNEPVDPVHFYLSKTVDYARQMLHITPNALTLGNLTCGLFSLIMSMNGLHRTSALLIGLAAICDFFDGRVARMLRATSDIGAQLDSLADVVSFGVAPAILAHSITNWSFLMIVAFVSYP